MLPSSRPDFHLVGTIARESLGTTQPMDKRYLLNLANYVEDALQSRYDLIAIVSIEDRTAIHVAMGVVLPVPQNELKDFMLRSVKEYIARNPPPPIHTHKHGGRPHGPFPIGLL